MFLLFSRWKVASKNCTTMYYLDSWTCNHIQLFIFVFDMSLSESRAYSCWVKNSRFNIRKFSLQPRIRPNGDSNLSHETKKPSRIDRPEEAWDSDERSLHPVSLRAIVECSITSSLRVSLSAAVYTRVVTSTWISNPITTDSEGLRVKRAETSVYPLR